ncbi:MAG: dTDP-4-dehydrorhamnose reductase [Alphaproteobacteria bacterium]
MIHAPQKILVFGKNGQVGYELFCLFHDNYNGLTPEDAVFLGRDGVDLSDTDALLKALEDHAPTAIINAAAYTAVDKAESEEALCMAVNAMAPEVMAEYAQDHKIPFIHISTDYVFDGTKTAPYTESDAPCPVNIYGKSKYEGEQAILKTTAPAVILRTSWVYAAKGQNFVHTMLRLGQERDTMGIVNDQIGAPTNAKDIARGILDILPQIKPDSGPELYHMCAQGAGSWYDFAQLIFEEAKERGLTTPSSVTPIASSAYPTPAQRPLNSRMDCSALTKFYGVTLPDWQDSARACLAEILNNTDSKKAIAS